MLISCSELCSQLVFAPVWLGFKCAVLIKIKMNLEAATPGSCMQSVFEQSFPQSPVREEWEWIRRWLLLMIKITSERGLLINSIWNLTDDNVPTLLTELAANCFFLLFYYLILAVIILLRQSHLTWNDHVGIHTSYTLSPVSNPAVPCPSCLTDSPKSDWLPYIFTPAWHAKLFRTW